ncbi:MAG: TetR/AcrR family transcriptional regulator [Lachnospiraceae bacterium]|nr:TetR/AcrR family transcriptional regulator [Lachnospiraceae bacterium]
MSQKELMPKVTALYQAVIGFFEEGADLSAVTVAEIAARAGIGKGTVYEYFSNKEEMIAGALYYSMQQLSESLREKICQQDKLYDKMMQVLLTMEEQMKEASSFLHLLHIKESSSDIGRRMKEIIEERKEEKNIIADVFYEMMESELDPSMRRDKDGITYLAMMVFSRVICYVMYMGECMGQPGRQPERIRDLICRGICDDVNNYRERRTWESAIS